MSHARSRVGNHTPPATSEHGFLSLPKRSQKYRTGTSLPTSGRAYQALDHVAALE